MFRVDSEIEKVLFSFTTPSNSLLQLDSQRANKDPDVANKVIKYSQDSYAVES